MKSIFLSVVVICALAIAGLGGTLANFSDTEEVLDNVFESGSLDLLVWDPSQGAYVQQGPYGTGATECFKITCAAPEEVYSGDIWVANFGDCVSGELYIAFKVLSCYNVTPSHPESAVWYLDEEEVWQKNKPEPEVVAEYGGWIEQWRYTPGTPQVEGDDCSWSKILEVRVFFDDVAMSDWEMLNDLLPAQQDPEGPYYIHLGTLPSCGEEHKVTIKFRYADQEADAWEGVVSEMFKDWPTNRYMLDGAKVDVMLGLVQPVGD
jgi:predicted ribosomally synthesized peptide with SipW-like signal peptide